MQLILTAVDESLSTAWQRFCGDLDYVEIHGGSILDVNCDAVVSPANSFGFMDGGIDAIYLKRFGCDLQTRLQQMIAQKHHGELLVGTAETLETGDEAIPYMIVAPTMRVPMVLTESVNAYLATRAALLCALRHPGEHPGKISRLAFPGMGTGVGQLSPNTCARQMRVAIDDVLLDQFKPPRTWAEASERHQLLYTDHPQRLQLRNQA
jgi:O-acetyl-ADP-ribose deacetylase (regulator of RNase III)